jgi:hypothetical protein
LTRASEKLIIIKNPAEDKKFDSFKDYKKYNDFLKTEEGIKKI